MRGTLVMALLFGGIAGSAKSIAVKTPGCRSAQVVANAQPRGTGPAVLLRVHCLAVPATSFTSTPPMVSPDGRRAFVHQYARGLGVYDLETGMQTASLPFDPTFLQLEVLRGPTVFEWAADSKSIWGADQQFALPSRFAKSPLQPIRIWSSKKVIRLPATGGAKHDLDGLRWFDGRGNAIALFDARGGFYRPERPVKKPILAYIDASTGRVRQQIPVADLPGYSGGPVDLAYVSTRAIATSRLPDGRSRVLIQWAKRGWTEWTEGGLPRSLALGYDRQSVRPALTQDGTSILVSNPLSASGMICEIWSRQKCPPPTPVTGLIAAAHSLSSGKRIWVLRGTATRMGGSYPTPAVSPDGRLAMIGLPANDQFQIALISMKDGQILQRFRPPWTSEVVVSFSPNGSLAFVSGGSTVVVYKIRRN